ncbi:MAG TPA: ABC transporter permease [Anaerolineaceae bacterium]|nr:ABC transporter permease [Anaerolineaceae bacterium]
MNGIKLTRKKEDKRMERLEGESSRINWRQTLIDGRSYIILIVLLVIFAVGTEGFINPINLLNMVKRQSYIAVAGFAATFVITLGGLDLSVGAIAALSGVSFALLLQRPFMMQLGNGGLFLSVVITLLIAGFCGFLNGFLSVKGRITPFLVTLATMNIYRSIAIVLSDSKEITITNPIFSTIFATDKVFGVIPTPVVILIVTFLLSWFLFQRTKYGYYVKAIGGNEEAARVSGIRIDKIKIITYTLNGVYAGIASLMIAGLYSSGSPSGCVDLALDSIAAVILGGTAIVGGNGKIWGTLAGILILAVIINGMTLFGAMYDIQLLVKGIVIILAVLLDNALSQRKKLIPSFLKFR